ncbi:GL26068 [Drosophila persimilis]|uniref:GL26068 n=1 Tax=Drosophila persimilis TaxID=7234 RepID=B4GKE8_DROPE|nr:uncharacterized protein LOC6593479 [Drosophila persimilis]EDW37114.1 GL26068 [Drosophila persimilis]
MGTVFWICWFFLLSMSKDVRTERNFRFVLDEIIVSSCDPDFIETFEFQISQINNRSYVDSQMVLKRTVDSVGAHATLDFAKENSKKMRLYDVQVDACLFLGDRHRNRLFSMYAKGLKKHSNLSCPFKANFNYTMDKMYVDEEEFPTFVPFGSFRSVVEYLHNDGIGARTVTRGRFIPRT